MSQHYTPEFKRNIVRLKLDEGRTMKSITAEYGVPKGTVSNWCRKYREECQEKAKSDPETINTAEIMEENGRNIGRRHPIKCSRTCLIRISRQKRSTRNGVLILPISF